MIVWAIYGSGVAALLVLFQAFNGGINVKTAISFWLCVLAVFVAGGVALHHGSLALT